MIIVFVALSQSSNLFNSVLPVTKSPILFFFLHLNLIFPFSSHNNLNSLKSLYLGEKPEMNT